MKGFSAGWMLLLVGCASSGTGLIDTKSVPVSQVVSRSFKAGEPTLDDPVFGPQSVTKEGFQRTTGKWRAKGAAKEQEWTVELRPSVPPDSREAILHAANGYQANLGAAINSTARIYPRFERKSFSWGTAVTFLVQYQNDNTNYVPNNDMLTYEIHGLTRDGLYVTGRFGVTHPHLTQFGPEVRDHKEGNPAEPGSNMKKDPDYVLVESCPPGEFHPSLTEIDRFVGTLKPSQP